MIGLVGNSSLPDGYNQKPMSVVHYVDRRTYNELTDNGMDPLCFYEKNNGLSGLTEAKMFVTHQECYEKLTPHNCVSDKLIRLSQRCGLNHDEAEAVLTDVVSQLKETDGSGNYYLEGVGKCYEIIPHNRNGVTDLLVVVEVGFLNKVTKTKEDLLEYFLTVLRHGYESGLSIDRFILAEYLRLKTNDNHFNLVQYRLS